jgi:hypothetical protein
MVAQAHHELQSSCSQPPKSLGLQDEAVLGNISLKTLKEERTRRRRRDKTPEQYRHEEQGHS